MYNKDEILAEADRISERIKDLDIVKEYHRVEQQIHNNKQIEQKMKDLKRIKNNLSIYKIMERRKH